jgi:hypothetical protein
LKFREAVLRRQYCQQFVLDERNAFAIQRGWQHDKPQVDGSFVYPLLNVMIIPVHKLYVDIGMSV